MTAMITLLDVAAEGGGAALLDGRHHAALRRREGGPDLGPERYRRSGGRLSATVSAARGTAVAQSTSWVRSGYGPWE